MSARIGSIEVPKSCEVLAERLRERILAGSFVPGDPLPAERDLVAETGLSRGSVREALRILEAEGMVQTRPGRYGGSIVCVPTETLLVRQVGSFVRGRGVSVRTLVETREALEPVLAQLAAAHRSDEDLQRLDALDVGMTRAAHDDVPGFLAANLEWHQAVAAASGNALMRAFMGSIEGMMRELTRAEHVPSPELRETVVKAHRRVVDAIRAGDGEAARRRMSRHVKAYSELIDDPPGDPIATGRDAG